MILLGVSDPLSVIHLVDKRVDGSIAPIRFPSIESSIPRAQHMALMMPDILSASTHVIAM